LYKKIVEEYHILIHKMKNKEASEIYINVLEEFKQLIAEGPELKEYEIKKNKRFVKLRKKNFF